MSKRPLGLRDRAVLEVFYSCGLRRSELIDLRLRDVDFDRGTVFVRCGKGAKDRYVPIGERALFWLRLYVELARPGFDPDGPRTTCSSRPWERPCARTGCPEGARLFGCCRHPQEGELSSVAPLGSDADARRRCGHPLRGRDARSCPARDHPALYQGEHRRLRAVHAATHPGAGLSTAMATELCAVLPGRPGLNALLG